MILQAGQRIYGNYGSSIQILTKHEKYHKTYFMCCKTHKGINENKMHFPDEYHWQRLALQMKKNIEPSG